MEQNKVFMSAYMDISKSRWLTLADSKEALLYRKTRRLSV